ncbi:hypothetical protein K435DRAFT_790099 [Dendrothele bispora CBS 962.96]|uniref:G-protein coupled receptors family 1 profile domain-containing protein n=1 Tax=Dendrothele bispora (strain CBS 962.96) TaxID=1314807 RepID=A0A4V4HI78_DENBC|nr:hypothetical protein K435DRAFT_790099 [Dendrothele bispora CBS 962.96]
MNSTDNPLASVPPQLADIIQLAINTFIEANLPSIHIIILSSLWLGVSCCLFITLLYSSDPKKRKTLLFISCIIAVGFGTVPSILVLNLLIKSFTATVTDNANLAEEMKPYIFSLTFFSFWSSICVDLILLIRLVPLLRLPGAPNKTAVLGPLFLLKLGRIVVVSVFVFDYTKKSKTLPPDDPTQLYTVVLHMPEPKVVWCLQLADNAMLRSTSGYVQRLRMLFVIAASNFVFPVIFVVIELILVTRDLGYIALAAINVSGINIEIIGILFATISTNSNLIDTGGSASSGRRESRVIDTSVTRQIVFRSAPTQSSGSTASASDIGNGRSSQALTAGETKLVGFQHQNHPDDLSVKAE